MYTGNKSSNVKEKDEKFRDVSKNNMNIVQIRPQKVKMQLRPGMFFSCIDVSTRFHNVYVL